MMATGITLSAVLFNQAANGIHKTQCLVVIKNPQPKRAKRFLSAHARQAGELATNLTPDCRPQTNWKLERYHQSIKLEVNQVPYEVPGDLEVAIAAFVDYYNHRRYHKALGNVTPNDVLHGWREEILIKIREVKTQTLASRKRYNRLLRESNNTAISP
jgi:hypothetical protein